VLQIGVAPLRIDILNRIEGVDFDEACAEGVSFLLDGRLIPVIGRAALMKNKRAVARPQDLADVAELELYTPVK